MDAELSKRIGKIIADARECGLLVATITDPSGAKAARELAIAITALEDAQMRVNRAGSYINDQGLSVSHRL
jgi:hypothetical protein